MPSDKKKILIVDDEESFADIVKLNLEYTGEYDCVIETDSTRALSVAQSVSPDLIILDMLMPDKDGPSVLAELQADKKLRDVPVVFLTAFASKEDLERISYHTRTKPHIARKPISAEDLIELVRRHLGQTARPAGPDAPR